MARQVLAPTTSLATFVRHLMVGGFEGERVHLPACADVQLLVYLCGGAFLIDPAGQETALPATFLVGAVNHPRLYRVLPGSRFVAVTFRPGGLHACFGIPAVDVTGRLTPIDNAALGNLTAANEDDAAHLLQAVLEDALQAGGKSAARLPPLHVDSLNRPVGVLARELGISVRQFERRCLVSLGMPLREYRRLSRYSLAMTSLMMQGAPPQALASLAQDAGYVDQAHFTRDFSSMVGQPPARFLRQRGQAEYQMWQFSRDELQSYLT